MAGVLIASDRQYHEPLRALFAGPGQNAVCCTSAGEARRAMGQNGCELLVVNAPLPDEFGRDLAVQAADSGAGVIFLCPGPQADRLAAGLEKYGIFVLGRPLSRQQAAFALRLIRASQQRIRNLMAQNQRLAKRLDEARVICQAKCVLARFGDLTEEEAHRLIEKRAMDARITSREAALDILQSYEDRM